MTRLIYENTPVMLETNDDCSSITLNFDFSDVEIVRELRAKLTENGYRVQETLINDTQLRLLPPRFLINSKKDEMTFQLQEYITMLKKEIQKQKYVLENLIGGKNWNKANNQETYIGGLAKAFHLAMATFAVRNKVDNESR